jgi:hypothetical protein
LWSIIDAALYQPPEARRDADWRYRAREPYYRGY